jgi:hypothetical protein
MFVIFSDHSAMISGDELSILKVDVNDARADSRKGLGHSTCVLRNSAIAFIQTRKSTKKKNWTYDCRREESVDMTRLRRIK